MRATRRLNVSLLSAALLAAAVFVPAGAQRTWSPRRPDGARVATPYLEAALQTAAWLDSLERRMGQGIGWAMNERANAPVLTGISDGAAGVGFFYLRLYQVTKNPVFLEKARRAADYVASTHAPGRFGFPEWFAGRAGEGDFFLALHAATGERIQRDRAIAVGEWLLREARPEAGGYYWVHPQPGAQVFTGLAHGTAGVVLFLTRLYELTRNGSYLAYARAGMSWMERYVYVWNDSAIGWRRLTTDEHSYIGWCGGSTGIYFVVKRLFKATGEEHYRQLMLKLARGMVHTARRRCADGGPYSPQSCPLPGQDALAWQRDMPGADSLFIAYCHGSSSDAVVLFDAYHETGDASFLEAGRAGARWLAAVAETATVGLKWEHIYLSRMEETGLGTGTAGVGHAFVRYTRYDPSPSYLASAKAAGDYLIALAERPAAGGMRWPSYTQMPPRVGDPVEYEVGWYGGAAGIGLFLLELHLALAQTGAPASGDDLSGFNP